MCEISMRCCAHFSDTCCGLLWIERSARLDTDIHVLSELSFAVWLLLALLPLQWIAKGRCRFGHALVYTIYPQLSSVSLYPPFSRCATTPAYRRAFVITTSWRVAGCLLRPAMPWIHWPLQSVAQPSCRLLLGGASCGRPASSYVCR